MFSFYCGNRKMIIIIIIVMTEDYSCKCYVQYKVVKLLNIQYI